MKPGNDRARFTESKASVTVLDAKLMWTVVLSAFPNILLNPR